MFLEADWLVLQDFEKTVECFFKGMWFYILG